MNHNRLTHVKLQQVIDETDVYSDTYLAPLELKELRQEISTLRNEMIDLELQHRNVYDS